MGGEIKKSSIRKPQSRNNIKMRIEDYLYDEWETCICIKNV